MRGLDPRIHDFIAKQDVDARDKRGHDEEIRFDCQTAN